MKNVLKFNRGSSALSIPEGWSNYQVGKSVIGAIFDYLFICKYKPNCPIFMYIFCKYKVLAENINALNK